MLSRHLIGQACFVAAFATAILLLWVSVLE